jgi:hypothetical protein
MEPEDTLAEQVANFSNVATKLGVTKVLDEFPEPDENCLHIIVIKPPGE